MAEYWVTAPHGPLPTRPKTRFFPVHEGRSFIVTGAAGGIGSALVELLVAEGARVAAWDLREDALAAVAARFPDGVVQPVHAILGSSHRSNKPLAPPREAGLGRRRGQQTPHGAPRRRHRCVLG